MALFEGPKEACGVFGVFGHVDAAKLTYFGLYALQHRGQESAGIVTSTGKSIHEHKGMAQYSAILFDPVDLGNRNAACIHFLDSLGFPF